MNLRSDKKQYLVFWVVEDVPTVENRTITGCRLPTARQVLLFFLAFYEMQQENLKKTVPETINATFEQILPFYLRARIPTLFRNKMGQEIKKLWEKLKPINKTTKAKREGGSEKTNGFKEKLDCIMKFWPRDAIERIQNEEDKLFLQSMKGDRTAILGPVDNVLATTEKKVLRRRHSEEEQRKKEANSVVDMTASSEEKEEETASQKRPVEDQVERFLQFIMYVYLPW